jgi:DNA invertase Pin-like site-specific DNA recombinase
MPASPTVYTEEVVETIRRMKAENATNKVIAIAIGTTEDAVASHCSAHGIKLSTEGYIGAWVGAKVAHAYHAEANGYARVSSRTQDYQAQVDALKAAGCEKIYSEKVSGKSTKDRREFDKLMRALLPGDSVTVVKLDRLARSTRDLANILHDLAERGCGFTSLHESWCDTAFAVGRLMMTIMGGIAEFERELIRTRCEEGIEKAKAKGKRFGRKAKLDAGQRRVIADRYAKGETMAALARVYDVGEATIWRALP